MQCNVESALRRCTKASNYLQCRKHKWEQLRLNICNNVAIKQLSALRNKDKITAWIDTAGAEFTNNMMRNSGKTLDASSTMKQKECNKHKPSFNKSNTSKDDGNGKKSSAGKTGKRFNTGRNEKCKVKLKLGSVNIEGLNRNPNTKWSYLSHLVQPEDKGGAGLHAMDSRCKSSGWSTSLSALST